MSILRKHTKANYTIIPNKIIEDIAIPSNSFRLLAYMLGKPNNWKFNRSHLGKVFSVSKRTISEWAKPLKDCGYLSVTRVAGLHVEWIISDYKQRKKQG